MVLGQGQNQVCFPLKVLINTKPAAGNYRLVFDKLEVESTGEGIYSIYIGAKKPTRNTLGGAYSGTRIGSLNLYALSAPGAQKALSLDVSDVLPSMLNDGKSTRKRLYVVVLFEGNILPDQTKMPHTGKLLFKKVSIVHRAN